MSNKDKFTDYDSTAANNTNVGGVNLAENSALPSDLNNAVREVMSHIKDGLGSGTPLYVDQTNDRVGVGTSSPSDKLEVAGNVMISDSSPELTFETTNASHYNWQIAAQENTADAFEICVGSADADASNDTFSSLVTVKQSGNVGIGVTDPDKKLIVKGTMETQATNSTNGWTLYTYTDNTFRINYNGAGADEIVMDTSGNVGIGTDSPSSYDSRGSNLVVGDSGDAGITIFSGATSDARLVFAASGDTGLSNGQIHYDNNDDKLRIATGGSDRVAIDGSGSVGIGTTSPATALHVSKTDNSSHRVRVQNGEGSADYGTDGGHGRVWVGGSNHSQLNSNGAIYLTPEGAGTGLIVDLRQGSAKSWGNIDGTGTTHIDDSYNMSSVTDGGTGQYDFVINNDMNNAHYCTSLSSEIGGGNGGFNGLNDSSTYYTTGQYRFIAYTNTGSRRDVDPAFGVVHGDLA